MQEITLILNAISQGDTTAAEQLWQVVYRELQTLAASKISREKPGLTITATGLVHEAYLKLVSRTDSPGTVTFENRRHFFTAAAEAMRRILIDHARGKQTQKKGGKNSEGQYQLSQITAPQISDNLVAINEALEKLSSVDPQLAELVKLRYFAGMTINEVAEVLNVSPRTIGSWWTYARAWLFQELQDSSGEF